MAIKSCKLKLNVDKIQMFSRFAIKSFCLSRVTNDDSRTEEGRWRIHRTSSGARSVAGQVKQSHSAGE